MSSKLSKTLTLAVALFLIAIRLPAQQELIMKITGMEGEFDRSNLQNWIEIEALKQGLAFSFNEDLKSTDKGDPSFKEITLHKRLDKSSPLLMEAAAEGRALYEAEIRVLTDLQGKLGPAKTLMSYVLRGVIITSYNINAEGKDPLEEITIRFRKLTATYRPGSSLESSYKWEGKHKADPDRRTAMRN